MPGIFAAAPEAWSNILPEQQQALDVLAVIKAILLQSTSLKLRAQPIIGSMAALRDYVCIDQTHSPIEIVRAIFLGTKNQLIREEIVAHGTIDESPVFPREIVRRALELHAASIILVHNHPSGDPKPSQADISLTRQLSKAASILQIALYDHIIVSSTGHLSLRAEGIM